MSDTADQAANEAKRTTSPWVVWVGIIAVLAAGWWVVSQQDTGPTLSQAMCSDLRAGVPILSMQRAVADQYSPEEFADVVHGNVLASCPSQLESNVGLRNYLEAWDIEP